MVKNAYGWDIVMSGGEPIGIYWSSTRKEYIQIHQVPDAGYYFVERSLSVPTSGFAGAMASQRISPVWIDTNKSAVGVDNKMRRDEQKGLPDWEPGNIQNAINFVTRYMRAHPVVKVVRV